MNRIFFLNRRLRSKGLLAVQWDELIEIHVIICAQRFHFCSVYIINEFCRLK